MSRLDDLRRRISGELPFPPAGRLLGLRITHAEQGLAVIEMDAAAGLENSSGLVQGGLLASLADTAMGAAVASMCSDEESWTTLEIKIAFLRSAQADGTTLRCTGRLVHRTRRVAFAEADITSADETIARVSSTLAIRSLGPDGNRSAIGGV